jgi:hypothetical protein
MNLFGSEHKISDSEIDAILAKRINDYERGKQGINKVPLQHVGCCY